ncbi:hypothetical protein CAP35_13325 [Chitinophagaceae bacterium IBVUCB1]|nr:hypothetical protein CAP35_13325 [Chitinophagaceae bacterium IBVUCB1]
MKKIILTMTMLIACINSYAQSNPVQGIQQINLGLEDVVEIIILNGTNPTMHFNTVNDFANGVMSDEQELLIRSNKNFVVRVRAQASRFAFAGNGNDPRMPLSVLRLKVIQNNTGGSIASGHHNFTSISTNGKNMITNATAGGNNRFKVQYRATPGYTYPAGQYAIDIIYTATQS